MLRCPECTSQRLYKDGVRQTDSGDVQRYLCRDCGYRFSEKGGSKSFNMTSGKGSICQIGAEPFAHGQVKNLAAIEPLREGLAGATVALNAEMKGKVVQFFCYMEKQGYAETTAQTYFKILQMLAKNGANLNDPESVKEAIAKQNCGKGRKWNLVKAYTLFLKMQGQTWEKPKYYPIEKIPPIPTEKDIDDLIAGSSRQMALFLQVLKETGARRGEAFNLKWTDIDLTTGTIRITPEKGSNPRAFAISPKLLKMLAVQPHEHEGRIWKYTSMRNLDRTFRKQRKRTAFRLQNPKLLQIHFHILRHWKATTEYAKTKDLLYVQKMLGHRNIKTTLRYTQLLALPQNEEYICKVAKTVEEATQLIEAGFQYVTDINDSKLFRKLKTSYLGT
ncbi:MAG: tyrosine-type recombinase/integrase [Candidatus Bathyarchaeota archaeon]|nr:tyrosine-type recombinase/integrase [Candidatus Bathyarchaeota archaeon]